MFSCFQVRPRSPWSHVPGSTWSCGPSSKSSSSSVCKFSAWFFKYGSDLPDLCPLEILLLVLYNFSPSRAKERQIRSREDRCLMDGWWMMVENRGSRASSSAHPLYPLITASHLRQLPQRQWILSTEQRSRWGRQSNRIFNMSISHLISAGDFSLFFSSGDKQNRKWNLKCISCSGKWRIQFKHISW